MVTFVKLSDHADPGHNSYGVFRLVATFAVIFSHAWPITGGKELDEPLEAWTGYPIGAHAVHVFFILSGLMVTASLERSRSVFSFVLARVVRIYPAMLVVTTLLIVLGGLFLTSAPPSDYWTLGNAGNYFLRNMLFVGAGAPLNGVFETIPVAAEVNSPLWTLKFEIICYASLVMGLVGTQTLVPKYLRHRAFVSVAVGTALVTALLLFSPVPYDDSGKIDHLIRMGFAFYLGSLAWHLRSIILLSGIIAALLFVVAVVFSVFSLPWEAAVQTVFLAYTVLWLGHYDYGWLRRFVDRQDYSYGVYITGWPIQQFLVMTFPAISAYQNFFIAFVVSLICAAISWNVIERPTLLFKKRWDARRTMSSAPRAPNDPIPFFS